MSQEKKNAAPIEESVRIKAKYIQEVAPALMKEFGYSNVMEIPKLVKITMNTGFGDVKDNPKSLQTAIAEMEAIVGQKVVQTKAKKSVANFKLREGMTIGAKVDLRGKMMYQFMDRLVSLALPRIRDFKGIPAKGFDGRGNYTLGIKEQLIFPEISYEKVEITRGFDITFVTTAKTDAEAKALLKGLGMPFNA